MKPKLFFITGAHGAGKSTTSQSALSNGVFVINPESIDKALKQNIEPDFKSQVDNSNLTSIVINEKIENKESFGVEATLIDDNYSKLIDKANESNYKTSVLFIGTNSADINKERIDSRASRGGYSAKPDKVEKSHSDNLETLPKLFDKTENIAIMDNSDSEKGAKPQIIKENGKVSFISKDLEKWVINSLGEERTKDAIKSLIMNRNTQAKKSQSQDIER